MTEFQVVQGDFADALGDALIFAASKTALPMLEAVYLEGSEGDQFVTFTATDRLMLGQRKINTVEPLAESFAALIPRDQATVLIGVHKAAARARRGTLPEPLTIKISETYLTAGPASVPLDVDNLFVKYRQQWPSKTDEQIEILPVDLALLVRLAKLSVFSRSAKHVHLRFSRGKQHDAGRYPQMISVECGERTDDTRIVIMALRMAGA